MAGNGTVLGTVVRWDDARGGGVIEALEVPGGCWADESVVVHGGGGLRAGQVVEFDRAEPGEAGFPFRALRVLPREGCRRRSADDRLPEPGSYLCLLRCVTAFLSTFTWRFSSRDPR